MSMMSDATIFVAIKDGAAAAGFPAGMPAFVGTLSYDQIAFNRRQVQCCTVDF